MSYKIVGYGSLVNSKSFKKTLDDKNFIPVIVNGYRRVFNLIKKDNGQPNILDVEKNDDSYFNGILVKVNEKGFEKLKKRESNYRPITTNAFKFNRENEIEDCILFVNEMLEKDSGNMNQIKIISLYAERELIK